MSRFLLSLALLLAFNGCRAAPSARLPGDAASPYPHEPPVFNPPTSMVDRALIATQEDEGEGFLGVLQTAWNPPDPHMAVGPEHLVVVTNGAIAFFDRLGNLLFQQKIEDGDGFWGQQGATHIVFDPEVVYDPGSGRFMAMANERAPGQPYFLLAVSDDSNPQGTWYKYRFNVFAETGGLTPIDSPNISFDDQAVYLTADFPPNRFLIYILEKGPLLDGEAPASTSLFLNGPASIGLVTSSGDPAPAQYMLEALLQPSASIVKLHAIQDPLGTPSLMTANLAVPIYQAPEEPPSLGTTQRVETFDARFWTCMYRNGSIWATHHVGSSRVRQRWYEFKINGWPGGGLPSLAQWGEIDLGADVRTFFGSIWADAAGNAAMVFARSAPDEFVSISRTHRLASDPPGEMRPSVAIKTSTQPVNSNRWGDYSAVVSDPAVSGLFWAHHQYKNDVWATWVAPFVVSCDEVAACCDADFDAIRDDNCMYCACDDGSACVQTPILFGDMGGPFGSCEPDGFVNLFDRNHALTCFAGTNPCPALNMDAGGPFGSCVPDGFCNLFDANHVLAAFNGTNPCNCPAGLAAVGSGRRARLELRPTLDAAAPGEALAVQVFIRPAEPGGRLPALQSYQLHLPQRIAGSVSGELVLERLTVDERPDWVFGACEGHAEAFNVQRGQMLSGLQGGDVEPAGSYMATYHYRLSPDASGHFLLDVLHDQRAGDQTFLVSGYSNPIEIAGSIAAVVQVTAAKP